MDEIKEINGNKLRFITLSTLFVCDYVAIKTYSSTYLRCAMGWVFTPRTVYEDTIRPSLERSATLSKTHAEVGGVPTSVIHQIIPRRHHPFVAPLSRSLRDINRGLHAYTC